MKISEHLDLTEVMVSDTAKRRGISNMPSTTAIANLQLLASEIFEPIRSHFGVPIHISSGYRSLELNKAIGGSSTSQHCAGEALDIDMDGSSSFVSNKDIFDFIRKNLPFDQLIWEFGDNSNPDWVHVSYDSAGKQRGEILRATRVNKRAVYQPFK